MDDDGLPWRHGVIAGGAAWLAGFVVFLVLTILQVGPAGALSNPLVTLVNALVFFLAAHLWPLVAGGGGGLGLAPLVFFPVPGMILFTAGYRVATVRGVRWNREAYLTGATVGAGYAALTVLSLLILALLVGGFASVPVYILIVGFTGGVVPLLAGGLGGIVASR